MTNLSIEADILTILNNIVQKGSMIIAGEQYSKSEKDEASRIIEQSIKFCNEELDPKKLIQLQNQEIMKKMKKKMVDKLS